MARTPMAMLAAALLAGCSTAPGTGWSRASDLSVYGGMQVYARAAVDQEVLCAGFGTASTAEHWERDFGARQQAVTEAMTRRYGPEAMARAQATWAPSVACGDIGDPRWRARYTRLLRLLETRLRLAPGAAG